MNPLPVVLSGSPITTSASSPDATWIKMLCPPHASAGDDGTGLVAVPDGGNAIAITWSEDVSAAQDGSALETLAGGVVTYLTGVEAAPVPTPRGGGLIWGKVTAVSGAVTAFRATFRQPPGAGGATVSSNATPADITASTLTQLASNPCILGFIVQADFGNTTNFRFGDANTSATRGFQMSPGQDKFFPATNTAQFYHCAESGSPKFRIVVL